jgi:DNA-binding MarR family transcriptional regulator
VTTEESTPLDAEEQRQWYALSYLLTRLPAELDAHMQRTAGLSHFEYQVLSGLSVFPERTQRMSDLARYTASTLSRLSNVVTRMEKRGWTTRRPDPTDGRFTLVTLTEAGAEQVRALTPEHVREVRRLVIDTLTRRQRQEMATGAERILRAIDPSTPSMADCVPRTDGRDDGAAR